MGSKMTFAFVIPESFWTAAGTFLSAFTLVMTAWLHSRMSTVEKNTDGINSGLRNIINQQEVERVQTAALTEKDKAIVQAQHEPQK